MGSFAVRRQSLMRCKTWVWFDSTLRIKPLLLVYSFQRQKHQLCEKLFSSLVTPSGLYHEKILPFAQFSFSVIVCFVQYEDLQGIFVDRSLLSIRVLGNPRA